VLFFPFNEKDCLVAGAEKKYVKDRVFGCCEPTKDMQTGTAEKKQEIGGQLSKSKVNGQRSGRFLRCVSKILQMERRTVFFGVVAFLMTKK